MSSSKRLGPKTHVDVNDRRLKPIYESLDNGDNKKALQEAERVLKKAKNLNCAKALKCLALIRLGRKAEAKRHLAEIRRIATDDENVLQALTACYKELPNFEQIVLMYGESLVQNPSDEATLTSLFNAYVRVGDSHNQQQIAMKLYKLFPHKTPYLFWVIMSYVMMSTKDNQTGKKLYLPLAEGMTLKYLKEAKHGSESEVMVYLTILERQKKYKELLDALNGHLGNNLMQNLKYKTLLHLKTLTNLQDWKELNTSYKGLLLENLDDFTWFKEYLQYALMLTECSSLLPLKFVLPEPLNSNLQQTEDISIEVDTSLESISSFLLSCVELAKKDGRYSPRAPYLAQLEFIMLMKEKSPAMWGDRLAQQYLELLVNYFDCFGDKPCCFDDLKRYYNILNHEEGSKLKEMLEPFIQSNGLPLYPENLKLMHKHQFIFETNHYLGFHGDLPVEKQLELVDNLSEFYQNGLKFGDNLTQTEVQPADGYSLMAAEILYDISMKSDDMLHLVRAISILDAVLVKSPHNFSANFLLIKYHATLGTLTQSHRMYELLEVKYIQNDTLGYILCNPLMRFGQFQIAKKFCELASKFYESIQRETTDFIISCYKYGTFDKVKEFFELKKKLTRSVQFASISVNKLMLNLIAVSHDHKATEELVLSTDLEDLVFCGMRCDKLSDNRDFKVMSNWKLYGRREEDLQGKSFCDEKTWLLLQSSTLRILWHIVESTASTGHAVEAPTSNDNTCVRENYSVECSNYNGKDHPNSTDVETKKTPPQISNDLKSVPLNAKKSTDDSFSEDEDGAGELACRLATLSLFEKDDDELSVFHNISVKAREIAANVNELHEEFFKSPLKIFLEQRLDESFQQAALFFTSVANVTKNPSLDKDVVPVKKVNEIIVFGCSLKNSAEQEKGVFSLNRVKCLEEAAVLTQHLCHLIVILGCCDQLVQPFRSKKSKKKSKKQLEIPNILMSCNVFICGLSSLHVMLQEFFKNSGKFLPDLTHVQEKTKQADCIKVIEEATECHDRMRSEMSDLLQRVGSSLEALKDKDTVDSYL